MHRLTYYELDKIWRKRSFLWAVCVLLVLNLLLLWYVNTSRGEKPPLRAYQAFQNKIEQMSENEKGEYISKLKETIDGVCFVQDVLSMQNLKNEQGENLANQAMSANPGVFEKYYEVYQKESYLNFTNSIWQEKDLIDEFYEEQQKVAGYNKYLQSVQENKDHLSGISIFTKQNENTFAIRNIEKSAKDYSGLSDQNVRWMPSKALSVAMESIWTDLFSVLAVFLFVGILIFEEKEKKLFYITYSTKKGHFQSIFSKLLALLIHCVTITSVLYGTNLLFSEVTIGFGDLTAKIQSVSVYMESNLSISILQYIVCSIFTKSIVLFSMGTILTALCICADKIFVPYITGFLLYVISYISYLMIPAAEKYSIFKYINLIGLLETDHLYGSYMNFNIGGYPISRLLVSVVVIMILAMIGILGSIFLFMYRNHFELIKKQPKYLKYFRPHASLLRYECYKIMIMNKAIIIILIFGILISYRILCQEHNPSVQEQYYRDFMMQLEGKLTDEKKDLILSEKERYTQAFSEIERVDDLVARGEIDENTGDHLKTKWNAITYFYPSFAHVLQQYDSICEQGGNFVYDTGYLYLFGRMNNEYLMDLLLLSLCIVIAFGNVVAMEFQKGVWYLLGTTKQGKRRIICRKSMVCIIAAMIISLIPVVCRFMNVSKVYPLHGFTFMITDLLCYQTLPIDVPIWFFILLLLLSQMMALVVVVMVVLLISYWRKNHIQAIFFATIIAVVPLVLKLLGYSFAGWFSVYPLYSWTALLL